MSNPKVAIIDSGTAGTIVANRLHKKLKKKAEITVIDPSFKHVYQPGFLFTMFNREKIKNLIKDSRDLMPKSVQTIEDKVVKIETESRRIILVENDPINYDFVVLATGARLAMDSVEWWDESIQHFYNPNAAERLYGELEKFEGGNIVISIADLPYKCPPAPVEAAMLMDDYFKKKGIRDKVNIIYTSPLGRAFAIETTNQRVEPYLQEKNIEYHTFFNTDEVDTEEKVIYSLEGEELEYDLLVMVPPHRGQQFIIDSGIAGGKGWTPTDRYTLQVV